MTYSRAHHTYVSYYDQVKGVLKLVCSVIVAYVALSRSRVMAGRVIVIVAIIFSILIMTNPYHLRVNFAQSLNFIPWSGPPSSIMSDDSESSQEKF